MAFSTIQGAACVLLAVLLVLPLAASADDLDALVRQYADTPATSLMQISPSGELIAFRRVDEDQDLILVYSLTRQAVVSGADVSAIEVSRLRFTGDDQLLFSAYEYKRLRRFRGELPFSSVYSLSVASGEVEQLLVSGERTSGSNRILPLPTMQNSIAGVSSDGEQVFLEARIGQINNWRRNQMALLAFDIGEDRGSRGSRIAAQGRLVTRQYFLDSEAQVLAREDVGYRRSSHRISVPEGDRWRTVYESEDLGSFRGTQGVMPGHEQLLALVVDAESGQRQPMALSLANGEWSALNHAQPDRSISRTITDINRVVQGLIYAGFAPSYAIFEADINRRVAAIVEAFDGHHVNVRGWSDSGDQVLVEVSGPETAGDFYLSEPGEPLQRLAQARPALGGDDIHPVVAIEYPGEEGLMIPALLTVPRAHAANPESLPLVVLPHGSLDRHNALAYDPYRQTLAARGYMVLQPQYRGTAGFGAALYDAGKGQWGQKVQTDLAQGVAYLSEAGMIDRERVCIMGLDLGGYLALAGAAFTSGVYQCVVSVNGFGDLQAYLERQADLYGEDSARVQRLMALTGAADAGDEHLLQQSPVTLGGAVDADVLLLYYKTFDEAAKATEALRTQWSEHEVKVSVDGVGESEHQLSSRSRRMGVLRSTLAFLDVQIGPERQIDAEDP
ncbi:alpha/beta hydrolase family protein [Marinimicrobium alkaliphilum]|uniref:alpha/beta hydrolase family protein n=1 Tax=Marinimicrobium alkaliphilum TaxID=2202654 RepID=UPI00130037C7|nr:prolyl oligopeptidase family serine peptidase [Marinimicrobium alkaliphilum]